MPRAPTTQPPSQESKLEARVRLTRQILATRSYQNISYAERFYPGGVQQATATAILAASKSARIGRLQFWHPAHERSSQPLRSCLSLTNRKGERNKSQGVRSRES